MGHMSRAMLERYSHIRMAAKRTAMDSLMLNREQAATEASNASGDGSNLTACLGANLRIPRWSATVTYRRQV
jgi:hypothetical protein